MALVKEIMGTSLWDRSSSLIILNNHFNHINNFIPLQKRRQVKTATRRRRISPVAAISDNFVRFVPEKTAKFKVTAVVTVRNKNKEDLKEAIVKQLDALTDKIGRNVVLQLISTQTDPSKSFFLFIQIVILC